jgi:acetyl-CoA carboxylase carboxyl transferase subunit alpha
VDSQTQRIHRLQERVEELPLEASVEIGRLKKEIAQLEAQIDLDATPWGQVKLARHPDRPYTLDYISKIFTDFREIHGDRTFGDDYAMIGGMARLRGELVMIIGHQKGRTTKDRIFRNYGMPKPEGYRKALRLMHLAEKFRRPVLTFIDTPGAYPGIGAERRGQAQAIAFNLRSMAQIRVPILTTIIGEGGSGGALAIGLSDRILMLENAVYSVISPESCSAILWKDQDHAEEAAGALKLTAKDMMEHNVVDAIIPEPVGGAQIDHDAAASFLAKELERHLGELVRTDLKLLLEERYSKFRKIGEFLESK